MAISYEVMLDLSYANNSVLDKRFDHLLRGENESSSLGAFLVRFTIEANSARNEAKASIVPIATECPMMGAASGLFKQK